MSDVLDDAQTGALRDRVRDLMPQVRADLEALTRIPSVSLDAFDQAHVEASAEATAALLRAEGCEVEIVREGGRPAVIGHKPGPPAHAPSRSTPTTTSSPPATTPCGTARPSSPPSAAGGSTGAAPPTTRPG